MKKLDTTHNLFQSDEAEKKERRVFFGIRDRVDRGETTPEQARNGWKPEVKMPKVKSAHEIASELKRKGCDRKESWSRYIQATSLRPDMDAKDWYKIFDEA